VISASETQEGPHGLEILGDVLCGVNGTRASFEAVDQAAWLAGPRGHLALMAVTAVVGAGQYRTAAFAVPRASRALAHAEKIALAAGVECTREVEERGPVAEVLLERSREHGVLAIGPPRMSRAAHLLVGGTATKAAHLLPVSVLVARRPALHTNFAERILVATDTLEDSTGLVRFATELALARNCSLALVHAIHGESARHPSRLAAQVEHVTETLGEHARVRIEPGHAHEMIVRAAAEERSSLVIVSSRRVGGLRALGSVSERVVHDAPCSVLVMRPEDVDHHVFVR
jgi:nucleotide-binding universal stress UspA family protein